MKATTMLTREAALAGRRWFIIDARQQTLGRVASEAAKLLRGKGNPSFTPHVDCGDFVVVINAEQIHLSGDKEHAKRYYRHSGFPGGIRSETAAEVRAKHPERLLHAAVAGMLPKNRLARRLASKLKVYRGPEHPHAAQQPLVVRLSTSAAATGAA